MENVPDKLRELSPEEIERIKEELERQKSQKEMDRRGKLYRHLQKEKEEK